jgi:hypothetical protein
MVVAEGTGMTGIVDATTEFATEVKVEVAYEADVITLVTVLSVSDNTVDAIAV